MSVVLTLSANVECYWYYSFKTPSVVRNHARADAGSPQICIVPVQYIAMCCGWFLNSPAAINHHSSF